MLRIDQEQRNVIFEPLFNTALAHARRNEKKIENINSRLAYCLKLLAGKNSIPAVPREIAHILLDTASKLGGLQDVTERAVTWEIETWEAVEMLARDMIKLDVERGIRCVELATLYQVRYWTRSPARFHGTAEEKNQYIQTLSSLLGKLELLELDFNTFDNWYFDKLE